MALAALYPGQKVELIGMSPEGWLLKTNYRNNTITGWIRPEDLPSGIDPAIFAEAKQNQAHRDAVAVAITNKSVIQGMTPDDIVSHVPSMTLADVHAALAYYFDHMAEIQEEMRTERERVEEFRGKHPSLIDAKLRQARLEEAS